MAVIELSQTPSACKHDALYAAWRRADARWELARYAEDIEPHGDLPEEVDAAHCTETHNALLAFLLHPADTLAQLAEKLKVVEAEGAYGFDHATEIMTALASDARQLWIASERTSENGDKQ